jgi:nitric-oxide synthase
MIGNGTGIAPFRGFWQQRMVEIEMIKKGTVKKEDFGKMLLYYGCRRPGTDELYLEEINDLLERGIIESYHAAYSSIKPKLYVQNLLETDEAKLFKLIFHDHAHFYVCGNIQMASDVHKFFKKIIQERAHKSPNQAEEYLKEIKV